MASSKISRIAYYPFASIRTNHIWSALSVMIALLLAAGCQNIWLGPTYKTGQEGLADAERRLGFQVVTPCYLPDDVNGTPEVYVGPPNGSPQTYARVIYQSNKSRDGVIRFIQERDNMGGQILRMGDHVTIEGNPAIVSENGVSVSIGWIKDGYHFDLTSSGYSRQEIVRVVQSMMAGCSGSG